MNKQNGWCTCWFWIIWKDRKKESECAQTFAQICNCIFFSHDRVIFWMCRDTIRWIMLTVKGKWENTASKLWMNLELAHHCKCFVYFHLKRLQSHSRARIRINRNFSMKFQNTNRLQLIVMNLFGEVYFKKSLLIRIWNKYPFYSGSTLSLYKEIKIKQINNRTTSMFIYLVWNCSKNIK